MEGEEMKDKNFEPFDLSWRLKRKREQIDRIDRRILTLLNQRICTGVALGKIKKEMGKKIYDPKREIEVLKRLGGRNRGPLLEKDLEKIFKTIIRVCRQSQKGGSF